MKLTEAQVRDVAELAKLALTDEEVHMYTEQLSKVLEYFEQLSQVDTSDVPPTASVLPLSNVLRDDSVGTTLSGDEVVANAAEAEGTQFRVSAVLDNS